MSYQFRILGPVALDRDGETVNLGPPKRVALATALLLEANQPVPVPRLIQAMWPRPPRSAQANLRTHTSALRRLAGNRLQAHHHAYQLTITHTELDAAQFTHLAHTGRQALAAGQHTAAITQLGKALALWRGTAGDGLPRGTYLDAHLTSLDEQRLDTFEDHIQARLHHHDDHPGIAADLRRHLTTWPTRERAWQLLILTLYRAGNPAAALTAYRQAHATLTEELGIKPGPQLRSLHRAVLARDPALDQHTQTRATATINPPAACRQPPPAHPNGRQAATAAARPDPHVANAPDAGLPQHPPATAAVLTGRANELATLTTALQAGRNAVITGRTGSGKTALAIRAAHAVRHHYPGGLYLIDLNHSARRGQRNPTPQCSARPAEGRCLILLDDVTDPTQLEPLLLSNNTTLLATSRQRSFALHDAQHIELGTLAHRVAFDLLNTHARLPSRQRDQHAMNQIATVCDGHPLAIRIAAMWLALRPQLPACTLAAHLASRPLDGLQYGHLSIRDALAADLQTAASEDPLAARVLAQLAHADAATPHSIAHQVGEDPSQIFFTLERLVHGWLVDSPQTGLYQTSGLSRAYAAGLAGSSGTAQHHYHHR